MLKRAVLDNRRHQVEPDRMLGHLLAMVDRLLKLLLLEKLLLRPREELLGIVIEG